MIEVSLPMMLLLLSTAGVILGGLGYRIGRHRSRDPLRPVPSEFTNWKDFVDRAARRMVEAEDEAEEREAMRLFLKASPYFICVSMVMMDNRLNRVQHSD